MPQLSQCLDLLRGPTEEKIAEDHSNIDYPKSISEYLVKNNFNLHTNQSGIERFCTYNKPVF
jgi:hypothetical protein